MKANIANNDIEELHKRRYVCKVCEFRNQIMINAIHADVFAIKNALLKLPAQRVLESGYFGIKLHF
jgi:hypothetical protein